MLAWKNSRDKGLASPPSPPASAPDSIIHQAPHTTLSPQAHGHSKVTNAPTRGRPQQPLQPTHAAHTRTYSSTCASTCSPFHTHIYTHKCISRLLTAMTYVPLCSGAAAEYTYGFVYSLIRNPPTICTHTVHSVTHSATHGRTCPAKCVVL